MNQVNQKMCSRHNSKWKYKQKKKSRKKAKT